MSIISTKLIKPAHILQEFLTRTGLESTVHPNLVVLQKALYALTADRVYIPRPDPQQVDFTNLRPGLVIQFAGGDKDEYAPVYRPRITVHSYGGTYDGTNATTWLAESALTVSMTLSMLLGEVSKEHMTSGVLNFAKLMSGPMEMFDEETKWPYVVDMYELEVQAR